MALIIDEMGLLFVKCDRCETLQAVRIPMTQFAKISLHEASCKECASMMMIRVHLEIEEIPIPGVV